ncbi:MAG: hypothetical protein ACXU82_13570 [Caulobacteraceae bacterium]
MLNRLIPFILGAALLVAPSTSALAADAAPEATVVPRVTVEGVAPPKMVQEQAQTFARTYPAHTAELGQIARWRDPICVQVIGLRPEAAAKVQARIEDVGRAVGLSVQQSGCTADIEVVFTENPQALMDGVARRREPLLGYFHRQAGGKLKAFTRPIQAWYVTSTAGGHGNVTGTVFAYYESTGASRQIPIQQFRDVIDDPFVQAPAGCGDSPQFTVCLQSTIKNVLVVADAHRLQGQDIGLLSDYVSMLALSQPRSLDGCNSLPSVIDLFGGAGCPGRDRPDGLTPADAAYLTSLYQSDPEARLAFQQGEIANRMAKILINASAGDRK